VKLPNHLIQRAKAVSDIPEIEIIFPADFEEQLAGITKSFYSESKLPDGTLADCSRKRGLMNVSIPIDFEVKRSFRQDNLSENQIEEMRFELKNHNETIASIVLVKRDGKFVLVHRLIDPQYRSKGLGTKLLRTAEAYIECIAKEAKEDQIISAVAIDQADVLNWLYQQGYRAASDEDGSVLARLLEVHEDEVFLDYRKAIFFGDPNMLGTERAFRIDLQKRIESPHLQKSIGKIREVVHDSLNAI